MDIGDILFFVLAAIGLVVSAVTKNAKKKAEETRRQTKPDIGDWNDDGNHLPEPEEVTGSWSDEPLPPVHAKTYWSYDNETIKSQEFTQRINDAHRKPKLSEKELQITSDQPEDKPVQTSGKLSLHDFNFRNAIIYSELLKPKHEEY